MFTFKRTLIAVFIVCACLFCLFHVMGRDELFFKWEKGGAYKATLIMKFDANSVSLSSDIYMKPVHISGGNITVHTVFSKLNADSEPVINDDFMRKVVIPVVFADNGAILSADIPSYFDPELVRMLKALIYTPETLTTAGEYSSAYDDYVYDFSIQSKGIINKAIKSAGGKSLSASSYNAQLGKFWIEKYEGSEEGIAEGIYYRQSATYTAIPFDEAMFANKAEANIYDEWRNYDSAPVVVKDSAFLNERMEKAFFNLNDSSNDSYFSMAALLAENPDLMAKIPEYLLMYEESENDAAARMIIGILEFIGTPEAQKTLGIILEDDDQSETSRMRAAVALNGIKLPTDDTVDVLKRQIRVRGGETNDFISNTSYLALGSVAGKLNDGGSDSYDNIRQEMLIDLQLQNIPENIALLAIGNTADEQMYDEVSSFLEHDKSDVRTAAVTAAVQLDSERFAETATDFVANEGDYTVRATVYDALKGDKSLAVKDFMLNSVYSETNRSARTPILGYLMNNADDGRVAGVLTELLKRPDIAGPQDRIEIRRALREGSRSIIKR